MPYKVQIYKPVNNDELELLDDYCGVDVEDRNRIHNILKRFNIGRVQSMNRAM